MTDDRDTGLVFNPKFNADGLVTAVVTDVESGGVLMVAHMNAQAIDKTLTTGKAHFFSRSRQTLWMKGESSGNILVVKDIRVDCDQDAIWIIARPQGPTCHTGVASCFYRRLNEDGLQSL